MALFNIRLEAQPSGNTDPGDNETSGPRTGVHDFVSIISHSSDGPIRSAGQAQQNYKAGTNIKFR